ncbi:MAG: hypothetical protein HC875_12655 [Anaerolineales bacterium]|nr:hypothetical protein [Anaerolineales bacterium]
MTPATTKENATRPLVEQLYESEGLTDVLTDEAAGLLLRWGVPTNPTTKIC